MDFFSVLYGKTGQCELCSCSCCWIWDTRTLVCDSPSYWGVTTAMGQARVDWKRVENRLWEVEGEVKSSIDRLKKENMSQNFFFQYPLLDVIGLLLDLTKQSHALSVILKKWRSELPMLKKKTIVLLSLHISVYTLYLVNVEKISLLCHAIKNTSTF